MKVNNKDSENTKYVALRMNRGIFYRLFILSLARHISLRAVIEEIAMDGLPKFEEFYNMGLVYQKLTLVAQMRRTDLRTIIDEIVADGLPKFEEYCRTGTLLLKNKIPTIPKESVNLILPPDIEAHHLEQMALNDKSVDIAGLIGSDKPKRDKPVKYKKPKK